MVQVQRCLIRIEMNTPPAEKVLNIITALLGALPGLNGKENSSLLCKYKNFSENKGGTTRYGPNVGATGLEKEFSA